MTDTFSQTTIHDNSITVFRSLISDLSFEPFSDTQLYDLSGIAAESAEGLCHGLLYLSESLESGNQIPQESLAQIGAWLKASAHVIPVMFELYEQANNRLFQMKNAGSAE